MAVIQVDSGAEHFIPYAKKKLRELHDYMIQSDVAAFSKRIDVSNGAAIYINSLAMGQGVFVDKIRITGGEQQFYWEEIQTAPEQDLWSIASAVLPTTTATAMPIQYITYPYLTTDSNVFEKKHQLVECRYCRRVAEYEWMESSEYGTNLVLTGATLVSYNSTVVRVKYGSAPTVWRILGEYVSGSGEEDPGVAGRMIPVMIKHSDAEFTFSTADWDGPVNPVVGTVVSRDDALGVVIAKVAPPTTDPSLTVKLAKNTVHTGEYVSHNTTSVTLYDYADDGKRTTRVIDHGLDAAAIANPWGVWDPDPVPPLVGYGTPGRTAHFWWPGPVMYQDGGRVFYYANPGWAEILNPGALTIYTSFSTGEDVYSFVGIETAVFDPYSMPSYVAWIARQVIRAKTIWDFVQSEMDKKRFCPTTELTELQPHPAKQFNKVLVFPVRSSCLLNITGNRVPVESYLWDSSYYQYTNLTWQGDSTSTPYSEVTWSGVSLQVGDDTGPIPKWTYRIDEPCSFSWNATAREFRLDEEPPEYKAFYFSFGTTEMKGYGQRWYFGIYRVRGKAPKTDLYLYDQTTNDTQMNIACLLPSTYYTYSGGLAYNVYSSLYAPLRGAYWRKTSHIWTAAIMAALLVKDQAQAAVVVAERNVAAAQANYAAVLAADVAAHSDESAADLEVAATDLTAAEDALTAANVTAAAEAIALTTALAEATADPYKVTQPAVFNTDKDPLAPPS